MTRKSQSVLLLLLLTAGCRPDEGNFKYGIFYTRLYKYNRAANLCRAHGMTLVTAKTPIEMAGVERLLRTTGSVYDAWLGLTLGPATDPANYSWTDGSKPMWTKWKTGDPRNLTTDKCVVATSLDYSWSPRNCLQEYVCFCQIPVSRSFGTGYFKRERNVKPVGPFLRELSVGSWQRCVDRCLRLYVCDLIHSDRSGNCRLYYSPQVNLVNNSTHLDEWRTYRRYWQK